MKKLIPINVDKDGNARTIKACYFKVGVANLLFYPNEGLACTGVIEYETDKESDWWSKACVNGRQD